MTEPLFHHDEITLETLKFKPKSMTDHLFNHDEKMKTVSTDNNNNK